MDPGANPIVTGQPPAGLGFGKIESDYQLATVNVGVAHQPMERLSVGVTAVAAMGRLKIAPAVFASPDDANGDTFFTYPSTEGYDEAFGGGFRVGAQYEAIDGLVIGLAYSSPIWFEKYSWSSSDELDQNRRLSFELDFPAYVNFGVSYAFNPNTRVEADMRWIDYDNTKGFDKQGYDSSAGVRGFGWESIFVFAMGMEHRVGDRATVMLGYNYGENPLPSDLTFFNVPAPAIVQHHFSLGGRYLITRSIEFGVTYYHALENSDSSEWVIPGPTGDTPVAGTRVRHELSENSVSFGLTYHFGATERSKQ